MSWNDRLLNNKRNNYNNTKYSINTKFTIYFQHTIIKTCNVWYVYLDILLSTFLPKTGDRNQKFAICTDPYSLYMLQYQYSSSIPRVSSWVTWVMLLQSDLTWYPLHLTHLTAPALYSSKWWDVTWYLWDFSMKKVSIWNKNDGNITTLKEFWLSFGFIMFACIVAAFLFSFIRFKQLSLSKST